MAENKKDYTFIDLKKCIGKNGNEYVGITAECLVTEPSQLKTLDSGKKVINFTSPINNRAKRIATMCGKEPIEKDGTCWARIAFWDSEAGKDGVATRFSKFISNYENKTVIITVVGSVTVEENVKNGVTYKNVMINANDFSFVRSFEKKAKENSGNTQTNAPASAPAHAAQTPVQNTVPSGLNGDFSEIDDDEDLPF